MAPRVSGEKLADWLVRHNHKFTTSGWLKKYKVIWFDFYHIVKHRSVKNISVDTLSDPCNDQYVDLEKKCNYGCCLTTHHLNCSRLSLPVEFSVASLGRSVTYCFWHSIQRACCIVNFSDCSLCKTLLRGWLLVCGGRSTSRRSWSLCTGYWVDNGWPTSWQLRCTNALMVVLRSTWQSSVIQASTDEISWEWEAPHAAYADFRWQVVCHRWSTHLEQPTWCHPRLVSVIRNIRKTVEIILVCLTTAAPVI